MRRTFTWPTTAAFFSAMLLLLGCGEPADDHCDPGFTFQGKVALAATAPELSFAPVLIQGYPPDQLSEQGELQPGAKPFYAALLSGPLATCTALPFHQSQFGYAQPARFLAWVDVDGHSLDTGRGYPEYEARPGPGDWVASVPLLGFSAPGSYDARMNFTVDRRLGETNGDPRMSFRLEMGEGDGEWPSTRAPLEVTVEAYRAEDMLADGPRPGAGAHFVVGSATLGMGLRVHTFAVAAVPQPMRLWAHGTLGAETFGGANEGGTLFAGEAGPRRAAVGLRIGLGSR